MTEEYAKLERICILNTYRGKNIGTILLQKMEEYLLSQGKTRYRLSVQNDAAKFYTRSGYVAISEPYMETETGIMHILMQKSVDI